MIQGLFDNGAMPALERMVQFTESRHRVLTNNIANLSNPYYKSQDLDPKSFQATLAQAIDERRRTITPTAGPLNVRDTAELRFQPGSLHGQPGEVTDTVLKHDESNVDLERTMQRLAENHLAHNTAIELIRNQFALLESAIRERT